MAKLMLILALCILPTLASARHVGPPFIVRGCVYCDTCHFGFETPSSYYIAGAKVRLECRNGEGTQLKYSTEGETDSAGTYEIVVEQDHKDDICEVVLVSSPKRNCAKIDQGRGRAEIVLTNSNGVMSEIRYANNLGFYVNKPLAVCHALRKQYMLDGADAQTFWRVD